MASVFRRGKSKRWTIEYTVLREHDIDDEGKCRACERVVVEVVEGKEKSDGTKCPVRVRVKSGTENKRTAEDKAKLLERQEIIDDTSGVTPQKRKLREMAGVSIAVHARAYLQSLALRARKLHVAQVRNLLLGTKGDPRDLGAKLGARTLAEVDAEAVEGFIAERGRRAKGNSARNLNHLQSIITAFISWAVENRRLESNPLGSLHRQDVAADLRYVRRPLSDQELAALFRIGLERGRGPYWMACYYLGLRAGEANHLQWSWLDLDSEHPTCTIASGDGKARRTDLLAVAPELLVELKKWRDACAPALPSARVFSVPNSDDAWWHQDFEAAGIERVDDRDRRADRHALRSTLATNLARRGVAPQVTMRLMRHSTIAMTMKYYTKLAVVDLADGIATLGAPSEKAAPKRVARAIGAS